MSVHRPPSEYAIVEDHDAGRQRIVARRGTCMFVCWTMDFGPGYPDGEWRRMREDETPAGRVAIETERELDRALRAHRATPARRNRR